MAHCPECKSVIPDDQAFCGHCGSAVGSPSDVFTRAVPQTTPTPPSSEPPQRFLPGTVLAGRYRIVGVLGRGGMGAVYRADDLKLGQPVALKFLPRGLEDDPQRLQLFLSEVRLARQISHPSVCRVFDMGEFEGQHYISMEYVDGEDLSSLLRRIGRLPKDKAIQIARQLCAGLAEAHRQGILHRDLKPPNVMIDGQGRARIMDFGLAVVAKDEEQTSPAGTPAYMAPEQITGGKPSVQSDLFSLGLVFYELFTGERAIKASSIHERTQLESSTPPTYPSTLIDDMDPAVERVIFQCLEPDPTERPRSATAVAAALPGGDPLAEALAAGETPSPELVAAAGVSEAMNPLLAVGLASIAVVSFILAVTLNGQNSVGSYVPMDKPPAAMVDRAQEIIRELGYTEDVYSRPADTAIGYNIWDSYLRWIEENDASADRWELLRTNPGGIMSFWYRQQPSVMIPNSQFGSFTGRVGRWQPFPQITGSILVSLDPGGTLDFFVHTPRRFVEENIVPDNPDWSKAFELAGYDIDAFTPVEPRYQRFMQLDPRAAWVGYVPGAPDSTIRIEAGMAEGRISLFAIFNEPGQLTMLADALRDDDNMPPGVLPFTVTFVIIMIVAVVIARANIRRGRVDRRGTTRLGVFVFGMTLLWDAMESHSLLDPVGFVQVFPVLATALFYSGITMIMYLAIEPFARRVWPSMLVSWNRLLGIGPRGRRDPLVGRSILAGLVAGCVMLLVGPIEYWLNSWVHYDGIPGRPLIGNWSTLVSQWKVIGQIAAAVNFSLFAGIMTTLAMVIGRLIFRRQWPAAASAVLVVLLFTFAAQFPPPTLTSVLLRAVVVAVYVFVLLRFGLVGLAACYLVENLGQLGFAVDWTAWHGRPAVLAVSVLIAIAIYAVWAATAGRTFLKDEALGG